MGKLGLRTDWDLPDLGIVHINKISGDATSHAHLNEIDSFHDH